jgi:hypothetical protein
MNFTSKRGRPKQVKLQVIEGGKQESRPVIKISREPIDICHQKGIINDNEHLAALHFRWLYTLKFGAPGVSAIDLEREMGRSTRQNDPEWQESREREYAMAVEKLRNTGTLKPVLNMAVFGHFPKYMQPEKASRWQYLAHNYDEILKLREGLDILVKLWGKQN